MNPSLAELRKYIAELLDMSDEDLAQEYLMLHELDDPGWKLDVCSDIIQEKQFN